MTLHTRPPFHRVKRRFILCACAHLKPSRTNMHQSPPFTDKQHIMRALTLLTVAISCLSHIASATISPPLDFSGHTSLTSRHISLSSVSPRQSLTDVSIDVRSLILALISAAAILFLIPPVIAFFAELFRRLGRTGAYDRVDSEYEYDYDYDSGTGRGR